jgi:Bacterial mobilisation protein (MobC)
MVPPKGRVAALGHRLLPMSDPESLPDHAGPRRRAREPIPRQAIKVKLSEAEREQLRDRAAELGVSVPRLLVESALAEPGGGYLVPREQALQRRQVIIEIFELRHLVATIANNVNQLAKVANTSGDLPGSERLYETLADVDTTLHQLRAVTDAMPPFRGP